MKTGILEMRRHYTNYFKGIEHFKSYRMRLVEANTYEEVEEVLQEVSSKYMLAEAE